MNKIPKILFQNDLFAVVDKPAGWLSVPARAPKPEDSVLSHWMRTQSSTKEAYVIHRLDRFTSGIMIFALSEEAQKMGNTWFLNREVKKVYHFLASPPPSRPAIQVKTPVDGKASQTLFEVVEKSSLAFWGRAIPMTGRFHQIREHAREGGFPLLGDGSCKGLLQISLKNEIISIPRVCLHAYSLDTPMGKFEVPLPEDLESLWRKIKND